MYMSSAVVIAPKMKRRDNEMELKGKLEIRTLIYNRKKKDRKHSQ